MYFIAHCSTVHRMLVCFDFILKHSLQETQLLHFQIIHTRLWFCITLCKQWYKAYLSNSTAQQIVYFEINTCHGVAYTALHWVMEPSPNSFEWLHVKKSFTPSFKSLSYVIAASRVSDYSQVCKRMHPLIHSYPGRVVPLLLIIRCKQDIESADNWIHYWLLPQSTG